MERRKEKIKVREEGMVEDVREIIDEKEREREEK